MIHTSTFKASAFIAALIRRKGEGYVYGGTGVPCTIALLQRKERQYGKQMGNGYFQFNGDYTKGKCGKWLGKAENPRSAFDLPMRVQDCSNYIQDVRRELGDKVGDASANMLWGQCKTRSTSLANMPKVPGVLVFGNSGTASAPRMHHVGVYVGNGKVMEAAGAPQGVIMSNFPGGFECWGYANFISYDLPSDTPPPSLPSTPSPIDHDALYLSQKKNSGKYNKYVKQMQQLLIKKGYKLPKYGADGDWGKETQAAFLEFQTAEHIDVDGICGPISWAHLLE